MKKIFIASDHAGFDLKSFILNKKFNGFYNINDIGCHSKNSCDYPDYANDLCLSMKKLEDSMGILICGTGIGMSIAANRHSHIRAALCTNIKMVSLSRMHNNSNVLCLGSNIINEEESIKCIETFIKTDFSNEERHIRRISSISKN